jgi:hypothetical protein
METTQWASEAYLDSHQAISLESFKEKENVSTKQTLKGMQESKPSIGKILLLESLSQLSKRMRNLLCKLW